jgi:hypothetical protein
MIALHVHAPVVPHAAPLPSRHVRLAQQPLAAVQVCPMLTQLAAWHVPEICPAVTMHDSPVQQSTLAVQTWPSGWQASSQRTSPMSRREEAGTATVMHKNALGFCRRHRGTGNSGRGGGKLADSMPARRRSPRRPG